MKEEQIVKGRAVWEWLSQGQRRAKVLVAAGLLGMVLIFLSELPSKDPQAKAEPQPTQGDSPFAQNEAYVRQMEGKLMGIVQTIDGVGDCQVMITLKQGAQYIYASEDKTVQDQTRDYSGQQPTKLQQKDSAEGKIVLVEQGDGASQPLIQSQIQPEINGVVVVCQGGKSPVVCQRVTEAVTTVLGIRSNQVCVAPKAGR